MMKCLMLCSFLVSATCRVLAQEPDESAEKHLKTAITRDDIISDLDVYKETINSNHINPYTKIRKKDFYGAVAELKTNESRGNIDELMVNWLKVNATIGDEHTRIGYSSLSLYTLPFHAYHFEEGFFIVAISDQYKEYNMSKIVAVNGMPMDEVVRRITSILPDTNSASVKIGVCHYLHDPVILHGLGISPSRENVVFSVIRRKSNDTNMFSPAAVDKELLRTTSFIPASAFLSGKKNIPNWYQMDDSNKYLYFHYGSCRNYNGVNMSDIIESMEKDIDAKHPEKLIIDLRANGGGNTRLLIPFFKYLFTSYLNKRSRIYVLIGRRTFSAAILNTQYLKKYTYATVVGESTSGNTTHFGDIKTFLLPNSKITLTYSTNYYISDEKQDGAIIPDVLIPERVADYMSATDRALNYVIAAPLKH